MGNNKGKYKEIMRSTTSKLTHICCMTHGIVKGSITMGLLSLVVFSTLHFAKIPAGGNTTWIILAILAILAAARGIYVAKSELWRLEHYKAL